MFPRQENQRSRLYERPHFLDRAATIKGKQHIQPSQCQPAIVEDGRGFRNQMVWAIHILSLCGANIYNLSGSFLAFLDFGQASRGQYRLLARLTRDPHMSSDEESGISRIRQ